MVRASAPIFTLVVLFSSIACSKASEQNEINFSENFTLERRVQISDSLGIGEFFLSRKYTTDSTICFTEILSKRFFEVNLESQKTTQIGALGSGPAEYNAAYDFLVKKDTLIVAERRQNKLHLFSLDDKQYIKSRNIDMFIVNKKIQYVDNVLYLLNGVHGNTNYLSSTQKMHFDPVPYVFQSKRFSTAPISLVKFNNCLYYVNQWENILHEFNLSDKSIKLIPFAKKFNFFEWKSLYSKKRGRAFFEDAENDYLQLSYFNTISISSKTLFIVSTKGKINKNIIFSPSGETIASFELENMYVFASNNNKLTLFEINEDGEYWLSEYKVTLEI